VIGTIFSVAYRQNTKGKFLASLSKKDEIKLHLNRLQATQAQLVQQEKIASLRARRTAASAHEIKEPLNFVNNFRI